MKVLEDLNPHVSLKQISRISTISLSGYYRNHGGMNIQRLYSFIKERNKNITTERPTHRYRTVLRNQGTKVKQKTARKVLRDNNQSLPTPKHRSITTFRN